MSDRLEDHSDEHNAKISNHGRLLDDLDENHQRTAGRVEHVATQVGRLKNDVDVMEGRLRGEVKNKLGMISNRRQVKTIGGFPIILSYLGFYFDRKSTL